MKKIRITHITKADYSSVLTNNRIHCITLGNGSTKYFKNINKAEEFISKTNKFLNIKLYEINELQIEIYSQYQRNWFYFNISSDFESLEYRCKNNFTSIIECMNLAVSRSHHRNGNHLTFKHLFDVYDFLKEIVIIIKELQSKRGNYAESYYMEVIIKRIEYLKSNLENYAKY